MLKELSEKLEFIAKTYDLKLEYDATKSLETISFYDNAGVRYASKIENWSRSFGSTLENMINKFDLDKERLIDVLVDNILESDYSDIENLLNKMYAVSRLYYTTPFELKFNTLWGAYSYLEAKDNPSK